MEYHHKCGYDRIHIFSGDILTGEMQRHARFCGPKNGVKPYDGSGKVKETGGQMPFWDVPYDLGSNEAIIGFDVDQKFVGGGFTLRNVPLILLNPLIFNVNFSMWLKDVKSHCLKGLIV